MTSSSPFECIDLNHAINRLSAYRLHTTLSLIREYARALAQDKNAPLRDLRKAVTKFEAINKTSRSALGADHPLSLFIQRAPRTTRKAFEPARRSGPVDDEGNKWEVTSRSGDRKLLERRRGINTIALLPVERAEHCEASE